MVSCPFPVKNRDTPGSPSELGPGGQLGHEGGNPPRASPRQNPSPHPLPVRICLPIILREAPSWLDFTSPGCEHRQAGAGGCAPSSCLNSPEASVRGSRGLALTVGIVGLVAEPVAVVVVISAAAGRRQNGRGERGRPCGWTSPPGSSPRIETDGLVTERP